MEELLRGVRFPGDHAVVLYEKKGDKPEMKRIQFATIRQHLGKTQNQMARILGVSPKAVQSFEQGWRNIPVHIERQILLILALKRLCSFRLHATQGLALREPRISPAGFDMLRWWTNAGQCRRGN
jgi:DNA-binding XRE family transcriptional regulator